VIVVGIDGSWPARGALRWAARYARDTGSVLRAVRVLEWPIGFTSASTGRDGPTLEVSAAELDHSYRHGMQRIFDEVDPLPDWELTFAEGPTALVLVELAAQADLLVLGSHEHADDSDAHVGDIGHYCIGHSRRPVVIVPVEYLESLPPEVDAADGLTRDADTLAPL
jgi:nucleotide-binding universal stress UspA family protein